jgi:hypothetical protein
MPKVEGVTQSTLPPARRGSRLLPLLWLLALLPAAWLAVAFAGVPHLGVFHDDAIYAVGAKAWAEGHGHKLLSLPGAPWQTKYPPLYSLLLAIPWKLHPEFPRNLNGLLVLSWLWLPALGLASRVVFEDLGFSIRWSRLLACAVVINPLVSYFAVSLMPEVMTATLMMAALAMAHRGKALSAGLLSALAVLTKTSAAPLLLSIPALMLWRKQPRAALRFAASAWPASAAWLLWAALHRAPGAAGDYYLDYLGFYRANHSIGDLPSILAANLPVMVMGAGRLLAFVASYDGWANYVTTLAGLASLLSLFRIAKPFTHYHAFTVLFLLQLAVWNFTPHERFLLPVLPLLIAGLGAEFRRMPSMSPVMRPAVALAAAGLLVLNARGTFLELPKIARDWRQRQAHLAPAYSWIRGTTPGDARFAAADDALLYLHTGRHARGMHFPTRFFYSGDRQQITGYFSDLSGFQHLWQLPYALILDRDHEMDLSPQETAARARQARSAPGSATLYNAGGATIRKLQSEREVLSLLPSPHSLRPGIRP